MQVPRPAMDKDLKAEEKELTDDINSLNKKVRRTCLSLENILSTTLIRVNIWRSNLTTLRLNYVIS